MQALLALVAAFAWGTGNLTKGVAGRRSAPRVSTLIGFGAGLVGAVAFMCAQRPALVWSSFGWGLGAGACQGLGWLMFGRALQLARISLAASLASATTTSSLFIIGVARNDPLNLFTAFGAIDAICAIVLLSTAVGPADSPTNESVGESKGVLYALGAGVMFMFQSLALKEPGDGSASLVILGTAIAVVAIVTLTLLISPTTGRPSRFVVILAVTSGFTTIGGDVFYLYALNRGPLSVAATLGQLHPLFTAILAVAIVRERPGWQVWLGIALAIVGAAALAAS